MITATLVSRRKSERRKKKDKKKKREIRKRSEGLRCIPDDYQLSIAEEK